jgi:drug/metabolite transporter superfamily protein YnfA
MPAWFHLSVLRFVARGTFWLLAPIAALATGLVLVMPSDSVIGRLAAFGGVASLFSLLFAIPHATSRLIELDRDGRLDLIRLAGQPPASLLWTLLVGLAAPFLVAALILGLPVMIGPRFQAADYVVIAITWVATLMLSIGSLAVPRGRPVDSRLVTMGLVTIVGITAALVLGDDRVTPKELFAILANRANSSFAILATALLIGMGVFIAGVLPQVMRNTARPATTSLPRRIAIQSWQSPAGAAAEFARGARLVLFPSRDYERDTDRCALVHHSRRIRCIPEVRCSGWRKSIAKPRAGDSPPHDVRASSRGRIRHLEHQSPRSREWPPGGVTTRAAQPAGVAFGTHAGSVGAVRDRHRPRTCDVAIAVGNLAAR